MREHSGKNTTPEDRNEGRFVIQKHDASRLHYDFRLAVDDVLKSWAIPKGPSMDPSDKRLAVEVGDHELDYADFEGVIPEHEYGAGTVLLWDRGRYRNLRADGEAQLDMTASHREGLIEIWLEGGKLCGGFALKRFRGGDKPQWLLIKMRDQHAETGTDAAHLDPRSVSSGRDLAAVAREESRDD